MPIQMIAIQFGHGYQLSSLTSGAQSRDSGYVQVALQRDEVVGIGQLSL